MHKATWLKNEKISIVPDSYIKRNRQGDRLSFLVEIAPSTVIIGYLTVPHLTSEPCIEIPINLLRVLKDKNNKTLIRLLRSNRISVRNVAYFVLVSRINKIQFEETLL
jgi:hypothetical protein